MSVEIQIEKDLPEDLREVALEHSSHVYKNVSNGVLYFKSGYVNSFSYYRRGVVGLMIVKNRLLFRRTHKNKRIYGYVQPHWLETLDGKPVDLNMCMCATCLGGIRVRYRERPEMITLWKYPSE